jgi:NHLM bacteriocin system ABC transporter ATP-binding protein
MIDPADSKAPTQGAESRSLERLFAEGAPVLTFEHRHFVLDDSKSVWLLSAGGVDLFHARPTQDGDLVERRHLLSAGAGQVLFGMEAAAHGIALVAVPWAGTALRKLSTARLFALGVEDRDARNALAAAIDAWLRLLAEGLTGELRPRTFRELQAAGSVELSAGECVRVEREPLWVFHDEGTSRLFGDADLPEIRPGAVFPLAARSWLEARGASRVFALSTPAYLQRDPSAGALAPFHRTVLERLRVSRRREAEAEGERLRAKRKRDEESVSAALAHLSAILVEGPSRGPAAAEVRDPPLHVATRLVCEALGVAIGPASLARRDESQAPVERIAHASGLRVRQVTLPADHWKRDLGPLIAFRSSDGAPVALVPDAPTRYTLHDVTAGTTERLSEATAQTLAPYAFTLYRRLPERALAAVDLLSFGLASARRDLSMALGMGVVTGLLGMVPPVMTGVLFDAIIPRAQKHQLFHVALGLFAAALATTLCDVAGRFAVLRIQGRMGASIQAAVWDRLLDLPAGFFRSYTSGDLASRALGVDQILKSLSASTVGALMTSVFGIFNAVLLFYYDAVLALLGVGLVLVSVAVTAASGVYQVQLQRAIASVQGKLSGMVFEIFSGIAKLRVSGAEGRAFSRWALEIGEQRRLWLLARAPLVVFHALYPLLSSMTLYAVLVGRPGNSLSAGTFIAFTAAFNGFLNSTLGACRSVLAVLSVRPTYERLLPLLANVPEVSRARAEPGVLTGEIELAHVSFQYRADSPLVLDDVSLRIKPGEFVAVVGASGSGKSTLLRLLLGFEKPSQGALYYNGQDLSGLDLRKVRRQIGVVLQNSRLLPGDILTNIIGSSNLTKDAALEAARMAGFDRDLEQMPMGLHTVVSEGTLSGGQRQRLMIARAVVRKPRILFFDEATSALDNRTQAVVSQSIEKLEATRVVIAHRLSTILHADRIVVLDGGRVVQSGTYEALLRQEGLFAELARRQIS